MNLKVTMENLVDYIANVCDYIIRKKEEPMQRIIVNIAI